MIEAIGLGRRPIDGQFHGLDARVGDAGDRRRGRGIVAVIADEDPVMVIIEPVERCLEHRCDDRGLVPRRNEDGDQARALVKHEIAGERPRVAGVDGQRAPDAPSEIDEVDSEVVDGEQQETDAGEQRELGRNAAQDFSNSHGCAALCERG